MLERVSVGFSPHIRGVYSTSYWTITASITRKIPMATLQVLTSREKQWCLKKRRVWRLIIHRHSVGSYCWFCLVNIFGLQSNWNQVDDDLKKPSQEIFDVLQIEVGANKAQDQPTYYASLDSHTKCPTNILYYHWVDGAPNSKPHQPLR